MLPPTSTGTTCSSSPPNAACLNADEVGLVAYYAEVGALFGSAAEQVDQILRGRKPGDIPLVTPQKFRLLINGKAAQALGLSIPRSLRQQADQVID